jgi:cyclopropane-fatty-acyl-phospholipid synthase
MLFEFKSRATGSVVMTSDVGKKVLPLIGKTADPKGIITVDQMPAAIAALEAACKRETQLAAAAKEKARRPDAPPSAADPGNGAAQEDEGEDPHLIGICQRVFPLIEMIKSAHAAGKDITWGV